MAATLDGKRTVKEGSNQQRGRSIPRLFRQYTTSWQSFCLLLRPVRRLLLNIKVAAGIADDVSEKASEKDTLGCFTPLARNGSDGGNMPAH